MRVFYVVKSIFYARYSVVQSTATPTELYILLVFMTTGDAYMSTYCCDISVNLSVYSQAVWHLTSSYYHDIFLNFVFAWWPCQIIIGKLTWKFDLHLYDACTTWYLHGNSSLCNWRSFSPLFAWWLYQVTSSRQFIFEKFMWIFDCRLFTWRLCLVKTCAMIYNCTIYVWFHL